MAQTDTLTIRKNLQCTLRETNGLEDMEGEDAHTVAGKVKQSSQYGNKHGGSSRKLKIDHMTQTQQAWLFT